MNATITQAADATRNAAEKLSSNFDQTCWCVLFLVAGFMLVIGMLIGNQVIPDLLR